MKLYPFTLVSADEYISARQIQDLSARFRAARNLTELDLVLRDLPGFEGCHAVFGGYMGNRSMMVDCPVFTAGDQQIQIGEMYYFGGVLGLQVKDNRVLDAIVVNLPDAGQPPLYASIGLFAIFGGQVNDDKVMMNAIIRGTGPITQAMQTQLLK